MQLVQRKDYLQPTKRCYFSLSLSLSLSLSTVDRCSWNSCWTRLPDNVPNSERQLDPAARSATASEAWKRGEGTTIFNINFQYQDDRASMGEI